MITYSLDAELSVPQFVDILARSGLAARRPVDDSACMAGMLANALINWIHGYRSSRASSLKMCAGRRQVFPVKIKNAEAPCQGESA